jgi:hypothetical protein
MDLQIGSGQHLVADDALAASIRSREIVLQRLMRQRTAGPRSSGRSHL